MPRAKSPQQAPERGTCPSCFRVDPDDRANCPNRAVIGCPPPVPISVADAVEVVCAAPCGGACGKHLAVPIGNMMKRRRLTELGTCSFDVCRARVVLPSSPAPAAVPPPISSDNAGE